LSGERAVSTGLSVLSSAELTNSNVQRCSDCDPSIVYRQCHTADTQYPILSVQLIWMTGRIQDFSDNSQRVFFRRISFLLPINFWNLDIAHLVLGSSKLVERVVVMHGGKSGGTGTSSRVTFSPRTKPCGTTTEDRMQK
jgi:hypothetical protein